MAVCIRFGRSGRSDRSGPVWSGLVRFGPVWSIVWLFGFGVWGLGFGLLCVLGVVGLGLGWVGLEWLWF